MSHYKYKHNSNEFTKKIEIAERINLNDSLPAIEEIVSIVIDPILKSINSSNISLENKNSSHRKKAILKYSVNQKITYITKDNYQLNTYENSFIFTCSFTIPKKIKNSTIDLLIKEKKYNITTKVKEVDFNKIDERSILKNINLYIKLNFNV